MSVRIAWADATYTSVGVLPTGARIGEDNVTHPAAVLLTDGSEALVVEGTPDRLIALLTAALTDLQEMTS